MTHFNILLYHGVHADDVELGARNSSGKHLSRSRFDREMRLLSTSYPLVSMPQIALALRGEAPLPDGAVAVTLDDGFRNNYTDAWPVLEQHHIPATIYLTTGFIGTGRRMWSDRLENAFLETGRSSVALELDGRERRFPLDDVDQRVAAFLEVKAAAKLMPNTAKDVLVDTVCDELAAPAGPHPLYDFLDWDEVREMQESELIEFGAHTIDHVSLAKVAPGEMRHQIATSIRTVGDHLGDPCRLFAYPEGQAHDFDDRVIAILQELGIDHCPSAIAGVNELATADPYHLLRTMVGFEGAPFPL